MTMPAMQVAGPQDPDNFLAERDYAIRKGGGMTEDRPIISWETYLAYDKAGQDVRRYALAYWGPNPKTGERGADRSTTVAMPAEKHLKWWGQGYLPVGYIDPGPPPQPNRWYPSMVEEAIAQGRAIPEELCPPGYYGPTFKRGEVPVVTPQQELAAAAADELADARVAELEQQLRDKERQLEASLEQPEIFRCGAELEDGSACPRFFDSAEALRGHKSSHRE